MRKAVSILIVFCVLAAVPVFEVSGASIAISKLSKKTAGPFDVIKIYGAGFTAVTDMRVVFSYGSYVVAVPPILGTKKTLEVGVPFFFDTKTGVPKSGIVKVWVKSKSLGIKSNAIAGFKILDLPRTTQPAGTSTLAFVRDTKAVIRNSKGQLDFLKKASKGKVNTTNAVAAASKMGTGLGKLETALTAIQKGTSATLGSDIKINKASLAIADRLILGYLAQLDAVTKIPLKSGVSAGPGGRSIPSDELSIPDLKEIEKKLASYAEDAGFDQTMLLEWLKKNKAYVGTAAAGLTSLAAFGLISPEISVVGGAVAVTYSVAIAGLTGYQYYCLYMSLPSGTLEAKDFFPLYKILFESSMDIYSLFNAGKLLSGIWDIYSQWGNNDEFAEKLVEPVAESAETIIPELLKVTAEGSWSGKYAFKLEGQQYEYPFMANFTESGLSLSGKIGSDGKNWQDVSGTICGYLIDFDWEESGANEDESWYMFCEYSGSLCGDGTSMGGTYEWHSKYSREDLNVTDSGNGTWILSR